MNVTLYQKIFVLILLNITWFLYRYYLKKRIKEIISDPESYSNEIKEKEDILIELTDEMIKELEGKTDSSQIKKEENVIKNNNDRIGYYRYNYFYSNDSRRLGYYYSHSIYNQFGSRIGYVNNYKIYDKNSSMIGSIVNRRTIYDIHMQQLGYVLNNYLYKTNEWEIESERGLALAVGVVCAIYSEDLDFTELYELDEEDT